MSSSEVTKQESRNLDGFDSYTDEVEGGEDTLSPANRVIQGTKLKYTLHATWEDDNEREVSVELVAVDVMRVIQKWGQDRQPLETIILAPGEKFPDIAAMNDKCPRSEWREDLNGNLAGPWQGQHAVYFVDPTTMVKYTWASPITTIGSARCVRDLVDQIRLMRRFRGAHVYPVVELSHTFMPTRFGGRERPLLVIKRWIAFGSGGGMLPAPDAPSLTAAEPKATPDQFFTTVDPPSRKEELGDSVPF